MRQTEYRQDPVKRLVLIRELERGIKHNILWLLEKYKNMGFRIEYWYVQLIKEGRTEWEPKEKKMKQVKLTSFVTIFETQ